MGKILKKLMLFTLSLMLILSSFAVGFAESKTVNMVELSAKIPSEYEPYDITTGYKIYARNNDVKKGCIQITRLGDTRKISKKTLKAYYKHIAKDVSNRGKKVVSTKKLKGLNAIEFKSKYKTEDNLFYISCYVFAKKKTAFSIMVTSTTKYPRAELKKIAKTIKIK